MNKEDQEMVARIRAAVEKECDGCEFQDGKHCSWWRSNTTGKPPCQDKYSCPGCGEEFPNDANLALMEYCPECGRAVNECYG